MSSAVSYPHDQVGTWLRLAKVPLQNNHRDGHLTQDGPIRELSVIDVGTEMFP